MSLHESVAPGADGLSAIQGPAAWRGPELSRSEDWIYREATIELVETTANDPALYLDMEFRPGDIQFLKNSVILHKRTAYEDSEEPERKRHLLRLWLAAPDFEDGDERLRRGIVLG